MKEIKLTQGKFVQVDDEDYEYLNQWKWHAFKHGRTFYAVRHISSKDKLIFMHRLIMNTPNNLQVDHKDRNGLNCQRYNMRNCTAKQNRQNTVAFGKSKYKGVVFLNMGKYKYIQAAINLNGKRISLGNFKTEEEAAIAFDNVARIYHGEFANLNFK